MSDSVCIPLRPIEIRASCPSLSRTSGRSASSPCRRATSLYRSRDVSFVYVSPSFSFLSWIPLDYSHQSITLLTYRLVYYRVSDEFDIYRLEIPFIRDTQCLHCLIWDHKWFSTEQFNNSYSLLVTIRSEFIVSIDQVINSSKSFPLIFSSEIMCINTFRSARRHPKHIRHTPLFLYNQRTCSSAHPHQDSHRQKGNSRLSLSVRHESMLKWDCWYVTTTFADVSVVESRRERWLRAVSHFFLSQRKNDQHGSFSVLVLQRFTVIPHDTDQDENHEEKSVSISDARRDISQGSQINAIMAVIFESHSEDVCASTLCSCQ